MSNLSQIIHKAKKPKIQNTLQSVLTFSDYNSDYEQSFTGFQLPPG